MLLTLLSGLKLLHISAVGDSATGTDVTITFTTDIAAYSRVQWGTVSAAYTDQVDNAGSQVTSHSLLLGAGDGLAAGTTYYYRVGASCDGVSWTYSAEGTFATDAAYSALLLQDAASVLLMETGDRILMESGASTVISNLPAASALDGSEIIVLVQGGATLRLTINDIATFVRA